MEGRGEMRWMLLYVWDRSPPDDMVGNSKAGRRPELIRLKVLFHMQNAAFPSEHAALLHANIHLDCLATYLRV